MKNLFRIARLLLLAGILLPAGGTAQPLVRRALFLGNSYTYVNDLPALVAGLASAAGDSLISAQNTPGGYTLGWQPVAHATNPVSTGLITAGGWDFVVIQEQSQIPSITRLRDSCMFPAAVSLNGMIKAASPCARSLFFLTWGRRFGGMQCFTPNYCSPAFTGFGPMQDSITVSYKRIADSLGGWIAPAGEAWRLAIDQGGIVLDGAPAKVLAEEQILREAGLLLPPGTELARRLREKGLVKGVRVPVTLEEAVAFLLEELK